MAFIPLIIIMGVMWALLIVPQQRRAKATREMLSKLEIGDEVLTSAGIYGQIAEFDGPTVFLAVSDTLEIKVTRESIAERVVYSEAEADAEVD